MTEVSMGRVQLPIRIGSALASLVTLWCVQAAYGRDPCVQFSFASATALLWLTAAVGMQVGSRLAFVVRIVLTVCLVGAWVFHSMNHR